MSSAHTISNWYGLLRRQVKWPRHNESEQAIFRVAICLALSLFLTEAARFEGPATQAATRSAIFVTGAYLFLGLILLAWMWKVQDPMPARRMFVMALDYTAISVCLFLAGESGSVLLAIYLWVTFGNGIRYGKPYLYAATVLSLTGFLIVFATSSYWHTHPMAGVGWIFALVVLPLYVSKLVGRLTQLTKEAQAASAAKSEFLARMSHELRTPLSSALGSAELLQHAKRLSPDERSLLQAILDSLHVAVKEVSRVLDFSKIAAGKGSADQVDFDLHAVLRIAIRMAYPGARAKGIRLTLVPSGPFLLVGDDHHLLEVLNNLLSNAVKFTESGSVTLRVSPVQVNDRSARIRFEVHDTGIGIDAESLDRIWESFTQTHTGKARRYGGTGLGTTIAKHLVEVMGGDIGVSSIPGTGSLFWFELPFERQAGAALTEQDAPDGRVLLVTADPDLADRYASHVQALRGFTTTVNTLEEAVTTMSGPLRQGHRWHLVLLDERLATGPDGTHVALSLLEVAGISEIAVLLITDRPQAMRAILNQGYAGHVPLVPDTAGLGPAIHAAPSYVP